MRGPVIERFPSPPGLPKRPADYLADVEEIYVTDAYHSLSIEGYRVSTELIERARSGNWSPDGDDHDRAHRDALAARNYWQAYRAVHDGLERVLRGENAEGNKVMDIHLPGNPPGTSPQSSGWWTRPSRFSPRGPPSGWRPGAGFALG